MTDKLLNLPKNLETRAILKQSIKANAALAKLNGVTKAIPNRLIIVNAITLQEAKDSSEIENIVTTNDEIYRAEINIANVSKEAKEVKSYKNALLAGVELIKNGILSVNDMVKVQSILINNTAGIRTQAGTKLQNKVGKTIYTPPQNYDEIVLLLADLEQYINQPNPLDSLVNMAIIHYQFEAIHPFFDGNGRTGRIINILYLMKQGLLDMPVLYLSHYIISHKADYYRLLHDIDVNKNWEDWILYMLKGVEQTSNQTIDLIDKIYNLMMQQKGIIRTKLPSVYSKDLLEVLFSHPYTKIDFLVRNLRVTRQTASGYLRALEDIGLVKSYKIGRSKYFIDLGLWKLLREGLVG